MAFISELIIYFFSIVFLFGQLARINFAGISFPIIDIAIFLIFLLNLLDRIKSKNLKIENPFFVYFLGFAWFSYAFNLFRYHIFAFNPILYLIRLTLLISFLIFPLSKKLTNKRTRTFLNLILISNILFGFIQYFIWPDFTYFDALSWDPHLYRLISTFFDPTFTAFIYLMFIVYVFLKKNFPLRWWVLGFTYIAMVLTYSRSSFLSFLLAFTYIAVRKKNLKIFIFSFLLITSTIFVLPRQSGEGTKLERTSSIYAKIENYKEGFNLFKTSPLIGHGYNNLYFVRDIKIVNSHANYGFESSLMTILTTTGLIGLILFLMGLYRYFSTTDLLHQTIFVSLVLHSLFANSLLYPWIILLLVFI
jgi:hypothetical protein